MRLSKKLHNSFLGKSLSILRAASRASSSSEAYHDSTNTSSLDHVSYKWLIHWAQIMPKEVYSLTIGLGRIVGDTDCDVVSPSDILLLIFSLATHHASCSHDGDDDDQRVCNFFEGSWVFDDSYPLYDGSSCPFIQPSWNCQKNGRPDQTYLKYRWNPTSCHLPRFNGVEFLEKFRGKKMMFVGDSLSSNMWQSMACMLHSAVPNSNYNLTNHGRLISTLTFLEYDFSVSLSINGFLVDLLRTKEGRVLQLDSLRAANMWRGYDVLIFNSYHWWNHNGRLQTWNYFGIGDKLIKDMDHMEAYKIALTTWSKWVDSSIDLSKTSVFYQGIASTHFKGSDWNDTSAKSCAGQIEPIKGSIYPGTHNPGQAIVKGVLDNMKNPVNFLDIELLTQLRKDGHPGKYGARLDCSHWCLAGVPDTWNQLLYASLMKK
ncbi:protein trichome birefringence-like 42 [Impatiens glandulifera]|uniref:protein trichome birefringence-like 42 n=1 Tax=Impatiens glandulifera TaxID=253017 RepID=UPI001FB0D235|nr:protein trichome birefringence-like 42 [Impatiens glandulifera]